MLPEGPLQVSLSKKVLIGALLLAIIFGNDAIVALIRPIVESLMIHLPA